MRKGEAANKRILISTIPAILLFGLNGMARVGYFPIIASPPNQLIQAFAPIQGSGIQVHWHPN